MAAPGAEFVTLRRKTTDNPGIPDTANVELQELEREVARHRDQPVSALLSEVVERVKSITNAEGAAIALSDQWGITCRASVGEAPELGSRLRPDSVLTRECFENGQTVVCEDTETDYRVRRSTAKSLRLRSALVVPLKTENAVLGVIEVLSSHPSAFNTAHVEGLQRVSHALSQVLAPASEQQLPTEQEEKSLASAPAVADESEKTTPKPALAPFEEPKSRFKTALVAVVLLLLLTLLYFASVRHWLRTTASTHAPAVAPPSVHQNAPETAPRSDVNQSNKIQNQPLEPGAALSPQPSATESLATTPPASSKSDFGSNHAGSTPNAAENTPVETRAMAAPTIRPAVPSLIVSGMPPGTQVFIDGQQAGSSDASGETVISTLNAGQHDLRLRLNGYRDHDQRVDVQTGETSAVVAKLEALDLPPMAVPRAAPVMAVTAPIPAPVTTTRVSADFVLEHTLKAHSGWVTSIAFSPDGQRLVSGSWDKTIKFWEVSTGMQLSGIAGKTKEIEALAFSRNGDLLATENSSNTATLRSSLNGQEIRVFPSEKPLVALGGNWVYSIAFSPDGRWLASGIDDKTVRLWDVKTGKMVRDLTGLHRPVIYIAFSPDGRFLATGDDEKSIRVWDPSNGEQIYKLSGHKKPVNAVAFSSNGRWLASASADKTVKLWDLTTGREVRTLAGHGNLVSSLAFSPDGRWLVSGSWDKTLKVWDVATGRELQTLTGNDHAVYSVAFDSHGAWLASGSEDGTIKLWRLSEDKEIGSQP